jgi:hypothetical protein
MQIQIPHNWSPRRYQLPVMAALARGCKRVCIPAHRRWGKDDIALNWGAISAVREPGTYWHCLPEYSQGRKAIWSAVDSHTGKRRIDQAFPREIRKKTRDDEMFIEFASGSTWQVIGSDRYDNLVGAGPKGIVFSEAALSNPEAWNYFKPMLEESNGWAIFISTVRGRNWFWDLAEMAKKDPNWYYLNSTADDTDVFSKAQLDSILSELQALWGEDVGYAKFRQEYFNDPDVGSFAAFIPGLLVRRGVEYIAEGYEQDAEIWGLDVARQGGDWSVLVSRQGRKVQVLDRWHEPDSMRLASLVADAWDRKRPDMLFVDGGGVGGPVCDRLKQLLPRQAVAEINFGWKANDPTKYANKRAEMWGRVKDAITLGLDLPNHKDLTEELSFPEFGFTPKNQILLEKKEAMESRGLHSPDHADALALTYADPVLKKRAWEADEREREEWEKYASPGGGRGGAWMSY